MEYRRPGFGERLLRSLSAAVPEAFAADRPAVDDLQAETQREIERLMRDAADGGDVVIVGRIGNAILAGRAELLRVFLYAPLAWRIEQIRECAGLRRGRSPQRDRPRRRRPHGLRARALRHRLRPTRALRSGRRRLALRRRRGDRADRERRRGRTTSEREGRPASGVRRRARRPQARGQLLGPFRYRDFACSGADCCSGTSALGCSSRRSAIYVAKLAPDAGIGSFYIGLLGASRMIPVLIASPFAGVVADRYPRRHDPVQHQRHDDDPRGRCCSAALVTTRHPCRCADHQRAAGRRRSRSTRRRARAGSRCWFRAS